jgi:hypothetical protein
MEAIDQSETDLGLVSEMKIHACSRETSFAGNVSDRDFAEPKASHQRLGRIQNSLADSFLHDRQNTQIDK